MSIRTWPRGPRSAMLPIIVALTITLSLSDPLVHNQKKVTEWTEKRSCKDSEYQCRSGRCIQKSWRCDEETDCEDGDDEVNCSSIPGQCGPNEYLCQPADPVPRATSASFMFHLSRPSSIFPSTCVPDKWRCDGEFDCPKKDDEIGCENVTCQAGQHKCSSFQGHLPSCIPESWVCDGQSDCVDMTDEANCTVTAPKCDNQTEFRCADNRKCIFKNWVCDGDYDCDDGSDEHDCKQQTVCNPKDHFICKTVSFCVPKEWVCDGEADCADKSDELDCDHVKLTHNVTCHSNEFKCKNGAQCISPRWVCDGDYDCTDHSDEADCARNCTANEKKCRNGVCLAKERFCDGLDDCTDGSDELNCPDPNPTAVLPTETVSCDPVTEYTCPNTTPSVCIKYEDLCRKNVSSDDCLQSVCNLQISVCNMTDPACKCRPTFKGGKVCTCLHGYEVRNGQCVDIDECQQIGTCDQLCTNTLGSYRCDCHPGYKLYGEKNAQVPSKCRAVGNDPLLLLSNRAAIRRYDLITNKYHPLVENLESAVAMDYWHQQSTLIWSDVATEKIMMCQVDNATFFGNGEVDDCLRRANTTLVGDGIMTPDGLAVDWVHGLLFWTDTGLDQISVMDLKTRKRRVIIDQGLDEPRAIAVDPSAGLIFWTDWGARARIERAGMNGENRMEILFGSTVRWPNGLAIDILERRIYWADAKVKMISSCDYYGKNVRTVLHSHQHLRHPFSLTVFEERLYWTDWDQEGVLTVNKFRGNDVQVLLRGIAGPMTVRVYHQQAQPTHPNKCQGHRCSHLCLPRAHILGTAAELEKGLHGLPYDCACGMGLKKDPADLTACIAAEAVIDELVGANTNFSTLLMMLVLIVAASALVAYIWKSRQAKQFNALQFDNPIYRRTVEDPDSVDFGHLDNSLGAIPSNPTEVQNPSRLVLNSVTEPLNTDNLNARRDFYHPSNYAYDQVPADGITTEFRTTNQLRENPNEHL